MTLSLLALVSCGGGVVLLSVLLARAVDDLARATGLGRVWLGAILLAGATSLPELATDTTAVLLGEPDLAVGDLFGSNLTNLFLLGLLDVLRPRAGILRGADGRARLSTLIGLSSGLTLLAGVLVALQPPATVGWLSPGSALLLVVYAAGIRRLPGAEAVRAPAVARDAAAAGARTARGAATQFVLSAAGLLILAPLFSTAARDFAVRSGLGTTFVGTWIVALATSLPEFVTCFAAVRLGSPDLAVGNIFGSNAFNMILFAPLDALRKGSFYVGLDRAHLLGAGGAIVLSGITAWLMIGGGRRRQRFPGGIVILAWYVLTLVALRLVTAGDGSSGTP